MPDDTPTPAQRARALLENNPAAGTAADRAQAWATLAVAEAVDRLANRRTVLQAHVIRETDGA